MTISSGKAQAYGKKRGVSRKGALSARSFIMFVWEVALASLTAVHGFQTICNMQFRHPNKILRSQNFGKQDLSLCAKKSSNKVAMSDYTNSNLSHPTQTRRYEDPEDTVRVRIWRALANGEELSLKQLASIVGESRDLRSHLKHVEKQAETLANKSVDRKIRRGLLEESMGVSTVQEGSKKLNVDKLRLKMRRGKKKHEVFVRLG